jgi:RNA polymerase sigma factor (TIGR02999 family)
MENITVLFNEMRAGNEDARAQLFTRVYTELTRIAKNRVIEGRHSSLDPPSLVHEAYLRLSGQVMPSLRDRSEFFAYSAAIMRNVMIDTCRRHNAQKRGAGMTQLTLSNADIGVAADVPGLDVETLHGALELLERIDARAHRVVELRFFAGLSNEEIAALLEVSPMTVKRSWKSARAFLFKEMQK